MIKVVIEFGNLFDVGSHIGSNIVVIDSKTKSTCDLLLCLPYLKKLNKKQLDDLSSQLTESINLLIKNIQYPKDCIEYAPPIANAIMEKYKKYFD